MTEPAIIELSADLTWPAEETEAVGPWVLRAAQGYSNRANSVRTVWRGGSESSGAGWREMIGEAEAFYCRRGLPTIFHISPVTVPDDLDRILAERGYAMEKSSEVWAADMAEVYRATVRTNVPGEIVQRNDPDPDWLKCAPDTGIGKAGIRERLCRRIPGRRVFASIVDQDRTVSRALGVVDSGVAWLYCMATEEGVQRRGYATRLLNFLAQWAAENRGKEFWLQVQGDNVRAQNLYGRAGFVKQYEYHYRILR